MKTLTLRLAAISAAVFALATGAQATTIDFEGQSNTIYSPPINRSGFLIGNVVGDEQHFHEISAFAYSLANNGSEGVLLNDRNTRIFVEDATSAAFTLTSVDVGSYGASGMNIYGYLLGNLVGTINVGSLSTVTLATVLGNSLGNVDRLVFDGTGGNGGFVLDHLILNGAQNAPDSGATLVLLGVALVGLATARRQRSA